MGELCLFQARVNGHDERYVELRRFSGESSPVFRERVDLQNRLLEKVMEDRERENWILPVPKWERKGHSPQGNRSW